MFPRATGRVWLMCSLQLFGSLCCYQTPLTLTACWGTSSGASDLQQALSRWKTAKPSAAIFALVCVAVLESCGFCPAWRSVSQIHAVPHLHRGQSLEEGRAQPAVMKWEQEPWPEQEGGACPGPGGHWGSR